MTTLNHFDEVDPELQYNFFADANSICRYYDIQDYANIHGSQNSLSIVNYNIRSFNKNFDTFIGGFLPNNMPCIMNITETRFTSFKFEQIPGYESYHTVRNSETPAGGISLFVKDNIKSRLIGSLSYATETIEVCTVEIHFENNSFVLIGIYRPHSDTIENFSTHLETLLSDPLLSGKNCILMGDLNICILKDSIQNNNFSNLLYRFHFCPVITKVTRFPMRETETPSLLDHIWINKTCSYVAGILDLDFTDHLPTFLHIKSNKFVSDEKIKIRFRVINDVNKQSLKNALENFNWESIWLDDVELYTDRLIETLDILYCSAFPLKTKEVSQKHFINSWMTKPILELIEAKAHYFYLYKIGAVTLQENNLFKNRVTNIVRNEKIKYQRRLFDKNRNDSRKTWKLINSLLAKNTKNNIIKQIMVNNTFIDNDDLMAETFNEYFCSIGNNLELAIPPSIHDPLQYLSNTNSSFYLYPVGPLEVEHHLNNLKNSKQNIDSISVSILKSHSHFLSYIFSDLINNCFQTGKFPRTLKRAIVLPLFKKGDRTCVSDYRPISILPTLSKVIERCIKTRLVDFIDKKNLFNPSQFGFRSGISTQDAIIFLSEAIYSNLNDRSSTIGVFIDFSKAFDTVNRKILLRKLYAYGIRGIALELIASFLTDRFQAVRVGNSMSNFKEINIGVPQGSVLGPILFILYINDISSISNIFKTCLFADDTTLIFEESDHETLVNSCNEGLQVFTEWCYANRLSINVTKTNFMVFSNRNIEIPIDIKLGDSPVCRKPNVTFLGLEIDDSLKFNMHISKISRKISQNSGILYKLRDVVDSKTLRCLYLSFIESYMNYCPIIFGNAFNCHLNQLEVAQKKCIRIISHSNYFAHTEPIFYNLKLLKFKDIYKLNLCTYLYKNMESFQFSSENHDHETRSSTSRNFIPEFQRLSLTQNQSIKYQAPTFWNALPDVIKNATSVSSFKLMFKNFAISNYTS